MNFKIGDFSKLSQVSIKALRYYDEMGLFKPAHIDNFSGYRYYTAEQMPVLNKIIALKNLGFSLEQITMLISDLPASKIREMLIIRRAQIQQQLIAEQDKLARVEVRLKQLQEESDYMAAYDVVLKKVNTLKILSIRSTIPTYEHVGELFEKICKAMDNQNIKFSGPGLSIYYDKGYMEKDVDVEAAMPVITNLQNIGDLKVRELPEIEEAACVVHQGRLDSISAAYEAVMQWIAANNYQIVGPDREIYLRPPSEVQNQSECITELQIPVARI